MLVIENCNSLSDLRQKLIDGEEVRTARQEPCEDWYDVPSDEMTLEQARQAVKDLRKKLAECLDQEPCEDAVSRQAVKEQMIKYGFHAPDMTVTEFVEDLPPVTPQPKTGHWILTSDDDCEYCTCSECGYQNGENWMIGSVIKFCQECGANMIEPQERSNKE